MGLRPQSAPSSAGHRPGKSSAIKHTQKLFPCSVPTTTLYVGNDAAILHPALSQVGRQRVRGSELGQADTDFIATWSTGPIEWHPHH